MLMAALCVGALLAVPAAPGAGLVPATGWIPNSLVMPPFPSVTTAPLRATWLHPTRRIVPQHGAPGRFLMGHALYGLWQSVPGYGWAPLTPQCLSIVGPLLARPILPMLPGCGVEGIAFDEATNPRRPLAVYVSTFDIDLLAPGTPIAPGGIYKAELPVGTRAISTAGLTWRPLLTGVRGNAILVKRSGSGPATIVAGRIQRNGADVGTDVNTWCAAGGDCSPSVYVSHDDGQTWGVRTFTGSPCSSSVGTSSRLVGGLDYDRNNPNVIYAAANSGLWSSRDNGATWSYSFFSCGNSPGFAITKKTPSGAGRVYVGKNEAGSNVSGIWWAPAGPGGPGSFAQLTLRDAATNQPVSLSGWTQSILIDERDPSERTLYVAAWRDANSNGGGGLGGVYKVVDQGNGVALVTDLRASFLEPARDCFGHSPNCLNNLNPPWPLIFHPLWRPSLFLAQHPLVPDLLYASSVYGGVWTKSEG